MLKVITNLCIIVRYYTPAKTNSGRQVCRKPMISEPPLKIPWLKCLQKDTNWEKIHIKDLGSAEQLKNWMDRSKLQPDEIQAKYMSYFVL